MTGVGVHQLLWGCLFTAALGLRLAYLNRVDPIAKHRIWTVERLRRNQHRSES